MSSWNQPNGTSPHFPYGDPALWPAMGGHGSPEPRPRPAAPLYSGGNIPYNNAHMNGFGTGRAPSNVPLNANGAPAFASQQQWSPAQLLNPRGFHSTPQQNAQNGFSNSHAALRLSFQFDSPAGTPEPSSSAHPLARRNIENLGQNGMNGNGSAAYANGDGHKRGMGDMLERMHNVTERDMMPQKRRRIDDPSLDAQRKAEFAGGSKGGVLGNYMREKKEEGQREARASGTTPVVTALDDDDDVEIVPDAGDKEVCYGRIEGAEILAFKVPTPRPGASAISNGYWPQVKIVLRRRVGEKTSTIHAVDSTREIIACVDVNTSLGLTPLLDSKFGIRTASRMLTRPKKRVTLHQARTYLNSIWS